jgi:hypothetical protein
VSRNCNLLQHDDKPLNALCHPQSSIKWYGFDPKTKKKEKSWSIKKNIKNVPIHQETNKKDKEKSSILVLKDVENNQN